VSIPRAVLLALALLQALGITDYMRRVACEEECKGDGCDDKGPCDCSTCPCHCPGVPSVTAPAAVAVDAAPPRVASAVVFIAADSLRASPDPREILHVPRAYAA
jgi:hypothetical protein